MPAPAPRTYNPRALGAACNSCPLNCKTIWPVPPRRVARPQAVVVIESPDGEAKFRGVAMQGSASRALEADLASFGLDIERVAIVHRIACYVPKQKRTDSKLRAAANACRTRAVRELGEALGTGGADVPVLYLGKWAPIGLLGAGEYSAAVEIKMSSAVMRGRSMCLTHPRVAYFTKPALRETYRVALERFVRVCLGGAWRDAWWGEMFLGATPEALEALRAMGPVVAYDAETLGTDPMSAPITAIGISDGERSVSLGWVSYENRHGYHHGIADDASVLATELREAVRSVLESDREKVTFNGSYDVLGMESIGIQVSAGFDAMDAYKILWPEIPANLEAVGVHILGIPWRWKTEFKSVYRIKSDDPKGGEEFKESPREALLTYNARDALVTRLLYEPLNELLDTED